MDKKPIADFVPIAPIPFAKLSRKAQAKRIKFQENIRSCFKQDSKQTKKDQK